MIHTQLKYISLLSSRLKSYTVKNHSPYLSNFVCPFGCGDGKSSKKRGYIYTRKGELFYRCWNDQTCSTDFNTFLKRIDEILYSEYVLEKLEDEKPFERSKANVEFETVTSILADMTVTKLHNHDILSNMTECTKLPDSSSAVKYLHSRRIFDVANIYYVEDFKTLEDVFPKYKDKLETGERIIFPMHNKEGVLGGFSCRDITGKGKRYVNLNLNDEPIIFGQERVKNKANIYVTEGVIDSLFLPNGVAVGSTNLALSSEFFDKERCVLVFDNQPRNKEMTNIMERYIDDGYRVFIWPNKNNLKGKDINNCILNGVSRKDILKIINTNIYSGLTAVTRFIDWKY